MCVRTAVSRHRRAVGTDPFPVADDRAQFRKSLCARHGLQEGARCCHPVITQTFATLLSPLQLLLAHTRHCLSRVCVHAGFSHCTVSIRVTTPRRFVKMVDADWTSRGCAPASKAWNCPVLAGLLGRREYLRATLTYVSLASSRAEHLSTLPVFCSVFPSPYCSCGFHGLHMVPVFRVRVPFVTGMGKCCWFLCAHLVSTFLAKFSF